MCDDKKTRAVIRVLLTLKLLINALPPFLKGSENSFGIATAYIAFNVIIILSIKKSNNADIKRFLIASVVIDQLYSVAVIVILNLPIFWMVYAGPPSSLLYYAASKIYIDFKPLLWFVSLTAIFFFFNMLLKFRGNFTPMNTYFTCLFAIILVFMIGTNLYK